MHCYIFFKLNLFAVIETIRIFSYLQGNPHSIPISYASSMSLKLSQHSTASLRDVLLQVSAKVIPGLRQQVVLLHCPIQKQPSRPGLSLFPHHRQASCHCKLSRADPREQLSLCPAAASGSYQPRDRAAQTIWTWFVFQGHSTMT